MLSLCTINIIGDILVMSFPIVASNIHHSINSEHERHRVYSTQELLAIRTHEMVFRPMFNPFISGPFPFIYDEDPIPRNGS